MTESACRRHVRMVCPCFLPMTWLAAPDQSLLHAVHNTTADSGCTHNGRDLACSVTSERDTALQMLESKNDLPTRYQVRFGDAGRVLRRYVRSSGPLLRGWTGLLVLSWSVSSELIETWGLWVS